jgi:hypothetical protein
VASAEPETAHNLEHSIANAGLPNVVLVGACRAERAALGRLARRVDVIVCSTPVAERVQRLVGSAAEVIIDNRALDKRAIEMLAALLVRHDGDGRPHGNQLLRGAQRPQEPTGPEAPEDGSGFRGPVPGERRRGAQPRVGTTSVGLPVTSKRPRARSSRTIP